MVAEYVKRMSHKNQLNDIWFWRDSAEAMKWTWLQVKSPDNQKTGHIMDSAPGTGLLITENQGRERQAPYTAKKGHLWKSPKRFGTSNL